MMAVRLDGEDLIGAMEFLSAFTKDIIPVSSRMVCTEDRTCGGMVERNDGGSPIGVTFEDGSDAIYIGKLMKLRMPRKALYSIPDSKNYAIFETEDCSYATSKASMDEGMYFHGTITRAFDGCPEAVVDAQALKSAVSSMKNARFYHAKITFYGGSVRIAGFESLASDMPTFSRRLGSCTSKEMTEGRFVVSELYTFLRFTKGKVRVAVCKDGLARIIWESGQNRYTVYFAPVVDNHE